MATMLNVSSLILRCYPDTSPWDLTPTVFGIHPPDISSYSQSLPETLRKAALSQALKTGLNPFHFMFGSNPFVLDDPPLENTPIPLDHAPFGVSPLVQFVCPASQAVLFVKELWTDGACVVSRVRIGSATRVLKLFLGSKATALFSAEANAYARFSICKTSESGAVPHCFGWMEVDSEFLRNIPTRVSPSLRGIVAGHGAQSAKGILLEDLAGAEVLSIRNITQELADQVLRSLYNVHKAHVLHGSPSDRHNVLILPIERRAVWVGFSHSACYGGSVSDTVTVSKQGLLAEMAKGWNLLYQRLLPDSLIGFEASSSENLVDPSDTVLRIPPSVRPSFLPTRPRPVSASVEEEIVSVICSYPEVNPFSWSPGISNLVPAPRTDHQYDTEEFLQALRDMSPPGVISSQILYGWYGLCPLGVYDMDIYDPAPPLFPGYVSPAPVPQLSSETAIDFVDHIHPSGHHAIMRVRMGGKDRVLKIFSKERRASVRDSKTCKRRFEIERNAYAHLLQYGACAAGAVPQCYGWLELSPAHLQGATAMIRRTYKRGFRLGEDPLWVSPVFEDGSPAAALVLEYLPNAEPLSFLNITHHRAELTLRSLTCVHGAYVLHRDLDTRSNLVLVRGRNRDADRVVVIDFDVAETPWVDPLLMRILIMRELMDVWIDLFQCLLPERRIRCTARNHPHELDEY